MPAWNRLAVAITFEQVSATLKLRNTRGVRTLERAAFAPAGGSSLRTSSTPCAKNPEGPKSGLRKRARFLRLAPQSRAELSWATLLLFDVTQPFVFYIAFVFTAQFFVTNRIRDALRVLHLALADADFFVDDRFLLHVHPFL